MKRPDNGPADILHNLLFHSGSTNEDSSNEKPLNDIKLDMLTFDFEEHLKLHPINETSMTVDELLHHLTPSPSS
jgi:hypothetical protein